MKIWKGAVLFCFAVAMAGQAAAQSTVVGSSLPIWTIRDR